MSIEKFKFDLIENAKDSLAHAVEHLTQENGPKTGDYKRVILDITHVVELILKERIRRIHPAFIWNDVDKYPSKVAHTITLENAVHRLFKMGNIVLSDEARKTILRCRDIRNEIIHFEFELDTKEAKAIIGRVLSFVFDFSKCHLSMDLETSFRKDDEWKILIELQEFWEAHGKALNKQLLDLDIPVCECFSCGAQTLNLQTMECVLCGHVENEVECNNCRDMVFESDAEHFENVEGSGEDGLFHDEYYICKDCLEDELRRIEEF